MLMSLQIRYHLIFAMQKQHKIFLLLNKNLLNYTAQNAKNSPNFLIDTINQPNFRGIRPHEIVAEEKLKCSIKKPGIFNVFK